MNITIYTSPGFPACDELRRYLQRLRLPFKDVDISVDGLAWEQMVRNSQQMGVPVIEINGQIIAGFDRIRIDKLLQDESQSKQ